MQNENQIPANRIRQILLLLLLIALGLLMFYQMTFMLSAFLGAVTLFMLLRRLCFKLVYERKWKKWIAVSSLMLSSFIAIVIPFAWVTYILINKISPIISAPQDIIADIQKVEDYLHQRFGIDILSEKYIEKVTAKLSEVILPIISSTAGILMNIVIAYFLLWFLLYNAAEIDRWLLKNLPFKKENRTRILVEVKSSVMSNAIGLPILAAIQGLLAAIGYAIFGIQEYVVWGMITGICSFIPFVGTMAAWVPLALLSFANGDMGNAWGQVIWGLVVIGMSDNIVRMFLQKQIGDAHPIVTVFGVIIGLNLFGFLGLIFGPLLISLFLLLVRIYIDEFGENESA